MRALRPCDTTIRWDRAASRGPSSGAPSAPRTSDASRPMSTDRTSADITAPPLSDAARALQTVLDMLLQDMALEPVDPATVPWAEPVLVIRSAQMKQTDAFLRRVAQYGRPPAFHIISHARDEDAIREI